MEPHWPYLNDVAPYAFGPALSSDGLDLKQAALRYLQMYMDACWDKTPAVAYPLIEEK